MGNPTLDDWPKAIRAGLPSTREEYTRRWHVLHTATVELVPRLASAEAENVVVADLYLIHTGIEFTVFGGRYRSSDWRVDRLTLDWWIQSDGPNAGGCAFGWVELPASPGHQEWQSLCRVIAPPTIDEATKPPRSFPLGLQRRPDLVDFLLDGMLQFAIAGAAAAIEDCPERAESLYSSMAARLRSLAGASTPGQVD